MEKEEPSIDTTPATHRHSQPQTAIAGRFTAEGIFLPVLRGWSWLSDRLSLNWLIRYYFRKIGRYSPLPGSPKTPAWVSEVYLLIALSLAIVGLMWANNPLPRNLWIISLVWPVYRLYETAAFTIGWVFVQKDYLHSVQRSLIGFLLNTVEVSFLLTTLAVITSKPLAAGMDRWDALAQTLAGLLTLSQPEVLADARWTALEFLRFGIGMFLVLCAFSSLAGGVLRRTVEDAIKERG
jgi:hypothetical protein